MATKKRWSKRFEWNEVGGEDNRAVYRDTVFPARVAARVWTVHDPKGFVHHWSAQAQFSNGGTSFSGTEYSRYYAKAVAERVVFNGSPRLGG